MPKYSRPPRPENRNNDCEVCGAWSEAGLYCFAIYLHDPEADNAPEARPPDAYIHARDLQEARRTLLVEGNSGILAGPFGATRLWDYSRQRLPAHVEIIYQISLQ